jgi:hypothetical protein
MNFTYEVGTLKGSEYVELVNLLVGRPEKT